jgi:hypothetical protein
MNRATSSRLTVVDHAVTRHLTATARLRIVQPPASSAETLREKSSTQRVRGINTNALGIYFQVIATRGRVLWRGRVSAASRAPRALGP